MFPAGAGAPHAEELAGAGAGVAVPEKKLEDAAAGAGAPKKKFAGAGAGAGVPEKKLEDALAGARAPKKFDGAGFGAPNHLPPSQNTPFSPKGVLVFKN